MRSPPFALYADSAWLTYSWKARDAELTEERLKLKHLQEELEGIIDSYLSLSTG